MTASGATWFSLPPGMGEQEWIDFLLGEASVQGIAPPPLPDSQTQAQFVGSSGAQAFVEARVFCDKLLRAERRRRRPVDADTRILDFGVGWGRLYRVMLNNVRPSSLVGVDVDGACVDFCREAMPFGTFETNDSKPPLRSPDASFDVVYAYSVFSHLAPPMAAAWMTEFHRLLRPGGIVAFTTLKAAHLDVWRAQTADMGSNHGAYLRASGFEHAAWTRRARRGEALYLAIGGGNECRDASFYGETVLSKPALRVLASNTGFTVYSIEDKSDLPQTFVVFERH